MMKRLFVVWLVILFTFLSGCAKEVYPKVNLSVMEETSGGDAAKELSGKPLQIAIASITSAAENHIYYDQLLSYLSRRLGVPMRVIQRSNYAEVNVLLRAGLVDVAFICSYSYVAGYDLFGLELVAIPQVKGKITYNSYIISYRDKGMRNFSDLQGQTFAFTDPMSTSGYFYPLSRLIEEGQSPESFFRNHIFTYSHDNSIRAVAEGLADGAAVDSLVFDYLKERSPKEVENIEILEVSPPYSSPPVVVRPDLAPSMKDDIRRVFLTMDKDPEGKMILKRLRMEAYVPINDGAYSSVRELRKKVFDNGGGGA